jgi:capsular polysaccharide biosynthesis protein
MQPTEAFDAITEPFAEPAEPFTEPGEPFTEPGDPHMQTTEAFDAITEPFAEHAEPFTEPADPFMQPTDAFVQTAEPLVQQTDAFVQAAEPFIETDEPVASEGAADAELSTPARTPPSSPGGAISRHRLLVIVCALALAAVGVAGGAARKGTYTASATLQVGKVNPNSPGFYGFVQSASDLATAFSRAITAEPVLATIHRRLGLSAADAVGRLSAEPLPSSPAFRIVAGGPTAPAAIALANVTSAALISYEAHANTYSPESRRLLAQYRAASLDLARASNVAGSAAKKYASTPDAAGRRALERAQAGRAAASLRSQALASAYQLNAQSTTTRDLISLLAGATTAQSDKRSKTQLLGFIGLLGGLVIGCAIAVLYEERRGTRRAG